MSSLRDLFNIQLLKGKELRKNKTIKTTLISDLTVEREEEAWGWRAASLDSVSPPIRHFYIFSYKSTSGLMSTSLVAALLWFLSAGIAGFWFVCSTSWPSTSRFRPVTWPAATSARLPVSLRDLTPPRPFCVKPTQSTREGREGRSSSATSRISP